MRIKKANAVLGTLLITGCIVLLYLIGEEDRGSLYGNPQAQQEELKHLEAKLINLENDVQLNANIVHDLKTAVKGILGSQENVAAAISEPRGREVVKSTSSNKSLANVNYNDGQFARTGPAQCDIQMDKVYDKLDFANPDGGVWKQGWDIKYSPKQWNSNKKLKVFVIPHSHNDPGWIKTFETYYKDQTNKILNNVIAKLQKYTDMTFIWAEISYFALWWEEQPSSVRQATIRLLEEGRLEIVTGGWVMPDEANPHYSAMIEQLITGHEWCDQNLNGYRPNNGWSIDPFGMSPTMAYILKRAGLDNMLIQRTHYSVKKELARNKQLEFNWRQHWDHNSTTDMLCHMMPFYSYDVPHTCGPDPKICCQFDFLRLPGGRATCPWRVPPRAVSEANLAERSGVLLDQYRKKAQLYNTDVLLIPLGDDFRWDGDKEWSDQHSNYAKIMAYVNSQPDLHATIQWGTLAQYFKALRGESFQQSGDETKLFPSLSGDFFTYADRDDHYWSGYFTSRPFWKAMDRTLGWYLRGAEVLYSLAWAEMEYNGVDKSDLMKECMAKLLYSRQMLGLFQHHDGITGTAKDHVMMDYGEKMLLSIKATQYVIQQASNYLLTKNKANYNSRTDIRHFDLDDTRSESWRLPEKTLINVGPSGKLVVLYNSQARQRQELVSFIVDSYNIKVFKLRKNAEDSTNTEIDVPFQISPVFTAAGDVSNVQYEISFISETPSLGLESYFIRQLKDDEEQEASIASVEYLTNDRQFYKVEPFNVKSSGPRSFSFSNSYIEAKFSSNGLLESVTTLDSGETTTTNLNFLHYGTRRMGDKSGAYLFLPDGQGRLRELRNPLVKVVTGSIKSYVEITSDWNDHRAMVVHTSGEDGTAVHIENDIDLTARDMDNVEISLSISSDVQSGDYFYTDLNGFQVIRRKRYAKLPIQGNWYPIPTMAYIQDKKTRLTLVSHQPLGGSSMASGNLEIMLDRRLAQDDNRGLFQGVQDNRITRHKFKLLVEKIEPGCVGEADSQASYPSLVALAARHSLLHPVFRLIKEGEEGLNGLLNSYSTVNKPLDCDIQLVNMRTSTVYGSSIAPSDKTALILHRHGFNSCYKPMGLKCQTSGGKVKLEDLFPSLYSNNVNQMSLSLMYEGVKMEKSFTVSIQPMEMYSFMLTR